MQNIIRFAVVTFAIIVAVPILHANVAPFAVSIACPMEAKLCPTGVTVGRDVHNNCEWQACPDEEKTTCVPYVCADGSTHPSCAADGSVIYYFAAPCSLHGGEKGACGGNACGRQTIMTPNWECPDGSVGGPTCMQDEAGTCGWRMRDCPNVTGFTDVATSNEFSDAIFYVKSLGIVQGYADGTFKPDATINRAEFTKMLVGNVSDQLENECIAPRISDALTFGFSDVFANDWFARYICVAQQDGIIAGYPDGSFSPSGDVNFAEAAKMLGISVDTHDFTIPPSEENEPWYGRFVRYLESRSAIPMSIVSFDQKITRGEMAEMIYRLRMGGDKQTRTYDELSRGVGETMFTVHFYTQHDVKNASGEANIAVVRRVPYSSNVADTALKALFAGPTAKEYAAGARTTDDLSSLGAEYRGVAIHATYPDPYGGSMLQNVAIVDFGAKAFTILNGAAVRQGMAKAAIEATLKQFPTIQNVLYTKDGELFVEWDA